MPSRTIRPTQAPAPAPFTYTVGTAEGLAAQAVFAQWDGTGAGGDFLPCASFYNAEGVLLDRAFPDSGPVTAGDTAEVSYRPFKRGGGGAPAVGGTLPYNAFVDTGIVGGFLTWVAQYAPGWTPYVSGPTVAPDDATIIMLPLRTDSSVHHVAINSQAELAPQGLDVFLAFGAPGSWIYLAVPMLSTVPFYWANNFKSAANQVRWLTFDLPALGHGANTGVRFKPTLGAVGHQLAVTKIEA